MLSSMPFETSRHDTLDATVAETANVARQERFKAVDKIPAEVALKSPESYDNNAALSTSPINPSSAPPGCCV